MSPEEAAEEAAVRHALERGYLSAEKLREARLLREELERDEIRFPEVEEVLGDW